MFLTSRAIAKQQSIDPYHRLHQVMTTAEGPMHRLRLCTVRDNKESVKKRKHETKRNY
jgi:hypothetical protein